MRELPRVVSSALLAVAVLASMGAKPADKKATAALLKAAQAGSLADAQAALKAGADINAMNDAGDTALSIAATAGRGDLLQALIGAGADVNLANRGGLTPLMHAIQQGSDESVRMLLAAHADVAATDRRGRPTLNFAAKSGSVAIVKALLAAGADVKATDEDGNTALHVAAGEGNADAVKALLASKADPRAKNASEETAYDVAQESGQAATAALVRTPGSKPNAPRATPAQPASAAAAAAPAAGGDFASGTLTVAGSTVKLTHAYLIPDTGTPAAVLVFLADGPVPRQSLRDSFALRDLTANGGLHVVRIRITNQDKQLTSMEMHHAGLNGGRTGVVGDDRTGVLTLKSFSPSLVEGKVAMAKAWEVPEGTYQYSATFRASLTGAAAVAATAPAAVSLADGKADGTFSVDGKTARLGYAYAWVDSKDSHLPVVLVLSDQAVPTSSLTDDSALMRFAERNRIHAIALWIDKDKQVIRGQLYDAGLGSGTLSVAGMHTFEASTLDARTVAGRAFTGSLQGFMGHNWEYAASFKATIRH